MIMIFATLALIAAPAPQTGARTQAPDELKAQQDFGACLARDRDKSGALLATVPGTAEERNVIVDLVREGCPNFPDFILDTGLLRGMVAEGMFQQDFGALGVAAKQSTVSTYTMPSSAQLPGLPRSAQYSVGLVAYAGCIVENAPQQSVALLRSSPGSAGERTAFAALGPTLGPCLPEGMTAQFTRPQLRGAVAEAAYRSAAARR